MHIKHIHESIEKLAEYGKKMIDKAVLGESQVDIVTAEKVMDMIESLAEAEYYSKISKAMDESEYGEDYDEYGPMDDGRRGYRGQPRSHSGRFMSRGDGRRSNRGRGGRRGYEEPWDEIYDEMEYYRDVDRPTMNRMYYSGGSGMSGGSSGGSMGGSSMGSSGGGSRGYSDGNYGGNDGNRGGGNSRYENARRGYEEKKQSGADKQEKMKSLEEYMKELSSDVSSMVTEMSPEEKSLMKQKMSVLMSKIS